MVAETQVTRPGTTSQGFARPLLVTIVSSGAVVLATVAPLTALASGPALLAAGLVGIRRAWRAGPPIHLIVMTVVGFGLCVGILIVAFSVRVS